MTDFAGEEARTDFGGGLAGEMGAFFGETRTDASGDLKRKNFKHRYHKIPRFMEIPLF